MMKRSCTEILESPHVAGQLFLAMHSDIISE